MEIQYITSQISYEEALQMQEDAVARVMDGSEDILFLVEHAPVYTCGTSANIETDFLGSKNEEIPLIKTGRGGQITYHGPGQRVIYPILNLNKHGKDLRQYICKLQEVIKLTLEDFNITSHTCDDVGVWVNLNGQEKKIAAIGVRVRKWVTFHGVALNVHPNMEHYKNIIPCGIKDKGITSMEELSIKASLKEVDQKLISNFKKIFNT